MGDLNINIDKNIVIALLCGLVSMVLSSVVPCLLKKARHPLLVDARKVFEHNKQVIVVSSLIVVITAYLGLSLYPLFDDDSDNFFDKVTFASNGGETADNILRRLPLKSNQLCTSFQVK